MGLDNPIHIIFLLVLLLLVFGAKRLPEIGRSLGTGMRDFKGAISGQPEYSAELGPAAQVPGDAPARASTPSSAEQHAQP